MKKRLAGAFLALAMVLSLLPVSALATGGKGSSASDPFTTVAEYNAAVAGNDWNGEDIYLTITGGTFDSSNPFNLTNVQSRANPPRLHLTITGATFTGNTANDSTNPSFMYLPNCQELVISNCTFDAGSGLKYGINWNLIQITGATVSITGCTFKGTYEENAIKLNQRGGEDDKATDIKPADGEQAPASITSATISGCTFEKPAQAIILLGSAGKNTGNAASPSTGAFPVTITADNSGANVFLAYLASKSEAEAAMQDPSQAIADGLVVQLDAGETAVKTANGDFAKEEDFVAEVNGDKYTTLQAALDAVEDNGTVTVLDDINLASSAAIRGTNVTLDLGNNTVKSTSSAVLLVKENSSVTISNGTLFSSNTFWTPTLNAEKNVTLTIGSNATVVGPYGLGLGDHTSTGGSGVTIHVYGTVRGVNASDNTNLLQYGGTVGIGINGLINSTTNYATIHIYDGAVVSGSHGSSGNLNSDDGPAIYAAGYANWIIDDGAAISGDEALSIKSGNFTINGGTFTATGTYADPATSWGNGTEATGAAISITTNHAYAKNVEMAISGGTFTSQNGYAIYENETQSQTGSALGANGLNVTGGTFTGAEAVGSVSSANGGQFISGGNFNGTVDSFVVAGMEQDTNGDIVIDTDTAVAQIGTVGYDTLEAAIAAAQDDAVITLLKPYDPSSNVLNIENKDLTLDLGGNTLTAQLDIKNSHVTLKNGIVDSPLSGGYLDGGAAVYVYGSADSGAAADTCVLNVESTATLKGYYGILISGPTYSSNNAYGAVVNVKGNIEGPIFISGNMGNTAALTPNNNAVTVNILSGANLNGNTCKGGATHTIAMNGAAIVNVADGATLTGTDAIAVKRGQLNITGGTFTATGEKIDPAVANNNGSETTGSAISVTSTYNKDITGLSGIDINISGGSFTSKNNAAVYLGHSKNGDNSIGYRGELSIDITGGSFSSGDGMPDVYVAEKINEDSGLSTTNNVAEAFIAGGTFTEQVRDYLKDDVQYEVGHTAGGYSYAKTLSDAQDAAQPGDTITDLTATTVVTLTLKYDDGVSSDTTYTVAVNTPVTLPIPSRASYTFQGWYDASGNKVEGPYTVTANATLTARWSYNGGGGGGVTTYANTVASTANGTVTVSPKNASQGTSVTLTVKPDEGYVLDTITVTDKDGKAVEVTKVSDTEYTFKMPASAVTVKASFKEETPAVSGLPFTDVAQSAWYYDAVAYVYENGMMTGTNDGTTFSPSMNLTRGMMAQVMFNIEQATAPAAGSFTDVATGAWYADAVNWAAANAIVGGYGDGTFGPEDSITREQMAVLLYNYAKFKGEDMTATTDLDAFSDGAQVSGWAVYAMKWAVAEGLISGSNNVLNPLGTASRAEVAQILMNYFSK